MEFSIEYLNETVQARTINRLFHLQRDWHDLPDLYGYNFIN